jgi:serine/threonine protein kinase/tetratricopeptide (TPR) repeat protein
MSTFPSPQAGADRNLLFGVLALQMDFITRDALLGAMQAWVFQKDRSLGQVLVSRGALAADSRELLEALVQKHLAMHGGDAQMSLAALSSIVSLREDLKQITDPDVQASLVRVSASATRAPDDEPDSPHTTSVGASTSSGQRFRVLRPHARGGLGAVFVAQDEELHREVALKEIQDRHADHPESRSRFLLEAEITGGLEHPGIVPVYGLGTYGDGRPYYAMRFIRGDSLKEAIERFHRADAPGRDPGERALELRKLLGRFIDVCNAIDYAHSRGVLHRDLKPGNIMLGQYGETLVVDWGLAKPMDRPEVLGLTEERTLRPPSLSGTAPTHMGEALGTPQYMSPEQAEGKLDQLGPASDVYSLGATLYCLLTGKPPFEDPDISQVLKKVQRGEFPPPRQVKPEIEPPLEAICLKAMALKAADRYPSTRALAEDIEKWRADEPVSAWPEPWTVKLRRWISRHRLLVSTASAAILVATVSLALATVLLTAANERERQARALAVEREQEAREQRDLASRQKEKAEQNYRLARKAVDRYHTEVSESVLLHEPGLEPLRKKLLEAAREFYEKFVEERQGDPGVQDELGKALFRLAQISGEIDSRFKAIELHRKALAVFTALAMEHPDVSTYQSDLAACQHQLGRLYRLTDQTTQAETSYAAALVGWKRLMAASPHPGPSPQPGKEEVGDYRADLARTLLGLGNVCQQTGRFDQARDFYRRALTLRAELARESPENADYQRDLAVSHKNLAACYISKREFGEAEANYRQASAIQEKLVHDFPQIKQYQDDLAGTFASLGNLYSRPDQSAKAELCLQKAAAIWSRLAENHPAVTDYPLALAGVYNNLGNRYRAAGRTADAERAYRLARDIREKLSGNSRDVPAHQADLAKLYRNLANLYRADGHFDDAETAFRTLLDTQEKLVREHPDIPQYQDDLAASRNDFGLLQQTTGHAREAEAQFRQAVEVWEKLATVAQPAPEHVIGYGISSRNLGDVIRDRDDPAAALDWYARAVRILEPESRGERRPMEAREALCNAYWGRAEALTRLGRHDEALRDWDHAIVLADTKSRSWFQLYRLATLARTGDYAKATDDAGKLVLPTTDSAEVLYKLAAVYALATTAARHDEKLPADERNKVAERYATRAVDLLTRANASNSPEARRALSKLEKDSDFEALHSNTTFKKLLDGLKVLGKQDGSARR